MEIERSGAMNGNAKSRAPQVMLATFTPGPWTLHEMLNGNNNRRYSIHAKWPNGTEFCGLASMPADRGDEELEANARLLAAAPDLLEALKMARHHIVTLARGHEDDIQLAVLANIDAAILHATSGTPVHRKKEAEDRSGNGPMNPSVTP